jgi:K+-transporting ATPase ATPase C chain
VARTTAPFRQTWTALRALLIFTAVLGLGYPLVVLGIGQLALPTQANGSLIRVDSGAGAGYDGAASSGSNYGPENADLIAAIEERRTAIADFEGVDPADVPADALTASASGLDPHISPAYALLQVTRVADARGLDVAAVRELVELHTQGRDLGYLGEATVNVLELNMGLAELDTAD